MSTDTLTSEQKLATAILGQNVCVWILDQRSPEPDLERSWRKIAENLAAATDGQVKVSGQTVRRWSTDHAKALTRRAGEVEWQEPPLPLRPPA